jgi:UDP-N-acetylmuramoylalanine--D-glutamate ligase
LQQSYDYCVLELSSFQLFYSQEWPWAAAAVTNLASDHLDWHLSLAHYHRAKLRIFARAQCCVVNRADNAFLSYSEGINTVNGRVCSFGSDVPSHGHWGVSENDECHYMVQRGVWQSPIPSVSALMQHDWLNLQASYALAAVSGCESPDVEDFLECYKGLPHRCQSVLQQDGIVWINDSKGTNVAAACAAISCVAERTSGRVIVLLGGVPKENDFSALAAVLQVCDCFVIVFGQAAPLLHNELAGQPMAVVDTLRQAVDEAMVVAKSGDAVLLSPACASWDQFKDFSDRGQAFTDYVFRSYHEASH